MEKGSKNPQRNIPVNSRDVLWCNQLFDEDKAVKFWTPKLDDAFEFAMEAHDGDVRKMTGEEFLVHPYGAVYIAAAGMLEDTGLYDDDVLVAVLLHDVIEKHGVDHSRYGYSAIAKRFGLAVANMVLDVSKPKGCDTKREASELYLKHMKGSVRDERSLVICAADKIHNLMCQIEEYEAFGDILWEKLNLEDQAWWHREILELLEDKLPKHPLTKQMRRLVEYFSQQQAQQLQLAS